MSGLLCHLELRGHGHDPEGVTGLGDTEKLADRCALSFAANNNPVPHRDNIPDLEPEIRYLGDPGAPSRDRRFAVIAGIGRTAILPILCRAAFKMNAHIRG